MKAIMFPFMKDESIIFDLLRSEISKETGIDEDEILHDSSLEDDLSMYDEDIEHVLMVVQDCLFNGDGGLVGVNALVGCHTVRDIMDFIADSIEGTADED